MIFADLSPTPSEIREQLARMVASARFRNAFNQSAFLKLVVERALQGKKTSGHVIAKVLFGEKFSKGESTDVRVTATNLRKTLKRYYATEGSEDLTIIALPNPPEDKSVKLTEGQAYTPGFSYNNHHAGMKRTSSASITVHGE